MALNQRHTLQDSRWPPRRSASRSRAGGQGQAGPPAAPPPPRACPVTAAEPVTAFDAELDALPARWPLAGDDPSAVDALHASARQFITLFHTENQAGPPDRRLWQVRREIEATGTYWHTPEELAFGARVAWRNSSRCIGRLYWHSLQVRDRREVTAAADIAAESIDAPARGDQRRPDPAGDHRLRAGRAGPARPADPQLPAGPVRGPPDRRRRRHRGPGEHRRHPPGPRPRLVRRPAARPVRRPPADRAGGRRACPRCTSCPPTRCSR